MKKLHHGDIVVEADGMLWRRRRRRGGLLWRRRIGCAGDLLWRRIRDVLPAAYCGDESADDVPPVCCGGRM
jgi:hypothetical protein